MHFVVQVRSLLRNAICFSVSRLQSITGAHARVKLRESATTITLVRTNPTIVTSQNRETYLPPNSEIRVRGQCKKTDF